ncbi:AcrR family transcriptional regulator [Paenibacillus phyllosphaerae]|uniref:AcrR family transcriptional regulator n=1 Tax=Paenibacillus phyllosphaerae TaxID=274593 RepID=A0A7W5AXY5_9BACL|nr:TetR/AcrR family transcriptional regulator [Paenibacillus phyllosphaerae]MBB3110820.1 AcrR family transcriptional regulator [Paenibacillus phyllosphaerae]
MCPRTKEQNEIIRQQRLQQIRHTAAEVLLEKGLRMEMGDIAEKAGLGRGTVYHYYNNKIELLEHLLQEALEEGEALLARTMREDLSPIGRLAAYARASLASWVREPVHFILFLYAFQYAEPLPISQPERLQREFRERLLVPVLRTIQAGARRGELTKISPDTLFHTFMSTLIGSAHARIRLAMKPEDDPLPWVEDVVHVLMKGIRHEDKIDNNR